ncbi:MAG TPA: RidA family protein [Acidimicrobiales bacterium]|nr:RidA family protein [Acidimicrobiales bacterium]
MERKDVNPWEWSKAFGFSQAVEIKAAERVLVCSGQTAIGPDGSPPTTASIADQVKLAFEHLSTVLAEAGMTMADVVKVNVYTTDVDGLLGEYGTAAQALAPNLPAMTLIGVTRLAFPELKVEIEAMAAR